MSNIEKIADVPFTFTLALTCKGVVAASYIGLMWLGNEMQIL